MTTTTRAAVLSAMDAVRPYADSRPLSIQTVTLDPPAPGEVRVAIKAAGLCHSDLSVINGDRPRPLPMALGHEAAGVVDCFPSIGPWAQQDRPRSAAPAAPQEPVPSVRSRPLGRCRLGHEDRIDVSRDLPDSAAFDESRKQLMISFCRDAAARR